MATTLESGTELWKSDGTAAGTALVADIVPGTGSGSPTNLVNVNDTLYFSATTSTNGRELWKSNGTAAGTVLVADINPGTGKLRTPAPSRTSTAAYSSRPATGRAGPSFGRATARPLVRRLSPTSTRQAQLNPANVTNAGGVAYFAATDTANGTELWKSDGTAAGTVLVANINPGNASSNPSSLAVFDLNLYFAANDGTNGNEVWRTNGTAAGTALVLNINPGNAASNPSNLATYNDRLYLRRQRRDQRQRAMGQQRVGRRHGTRTQHQPGVGRLRHHWPPDHRRRALLRGQRRRNRLRALDQQRHGGWHGACQGHHARRTGSAPNGLVVAGGKLYFAAADLAYGRELWKSDGTEAGTVLVADVNATTQDSTPGSLVNVNGTLFFSATTADLGTEFWKSDGTPGGTVLVADISPGTASSSPGNLINVNGTVFFSATTSANGRELWKSNGTAAGTVLVRDINPGTAGSIDTVDLVVNVNDTIYFRHDSSGGYRIVEE